MYDRRVLLAALAPITWMHAQTWSPINFPSVEHLPSCSFLGPDTGWVIQSSGGVSADSIYKTTDGGSTWISQP